MEYIVGSQIVIRNISPFLMEYIDKNYTIANPEYAKKERLGLFTKTTPKTIQLYYRNGFDVAIPFGAFKDLWNFQKGLVENYLTEKKPAKFGWNKSIHLYEYQRKAVEKMLDAKNGILVAKCGSGKTLMAMALIAKLGLKTLWLTHTTKLLEQSKKVAEQTFRVAEIGEITNGKVNIGKDITFATIQTICKIDPNIYRNEFNVIICDECHKLFYNASALHMWSYVLNNLNARYKYGLTATPYRADGLAKGMFALLGDVIYEVNEVASLPIFYTQIENDFNLRNDFLNADGTIDYVNLVNTLCYSKERNEFIANEIIKNKGEKSIALCLRIEQCKALEFLLKQKGVDAYFLKSNDKNTDFNHDVIVSTFQLCKEGLDCKELDTLFICSPIKDKVAVVQSVGRIQRKSENKEKCFVYDFIEKNIPICINFGKVRKNIIKKL